MKSYEFGRTFDECVFCGDSPTTLEHILSGWANRHLTQPSVEPVKHSMTHADRIVAEWDAPGIDIQLKAPCEGCNSGWMSRLETAAKCLIVPMLSGETVVLDRQAQTTLATWTITTLMLYQLFHPADRGVPPEHYGALYEDHTRPPGKNTLVWLSRYDPRDDAGRYYAAPLRRDRSSPTEGYIGVFNLGQVMFVGASNSSVEPMVEVPHPALLRIWPTAKKRPVSWPPGKLCYDLRGFHGIVDSFMVDDVPPVSEAA
jgi:hypothetical protein